MSTKNDGPQSRWRPCPKEAVSLLAVLPSREIARRFNTGRNQVRRWRSEHGITVPTGRSRFPPEKVVLPVKYPGMIAAFVRGDTLQAIGDRYGISRERVRQLMLNDGLPPRRGGK